MSKNGIPQHIAIIMDGNGRWASSKNLPRFQGHLEGVRRVEEIVLAASRRGVKVLTLYTFSTENWNRPAQEVAMLMKTFSAVLEKKVRVLMEANVRLHMIGRRESVPSDVLASIEKAVEQTKGNSGLILNLAFNYGARTEIIDAVQSIARDVKKGVIGVDQINEQTLSRALYTDGLPDPDLLIRTSGEKRISNFLLWQLSYAEFYFTETYWPDFDEREFEKALSDFEKRERRYGKVAASSP